MVLAAGTDWLVVFFWAVVVTLVGFVGCLWVASHMRHSVVARVGGFLLCAGFGLVALVRNISTSVANPYDSWDTRLSRAMESSNFVVMVILAVLAAVSSGFVVMVSAMARLELDALKAQGAEPDEGSRLKKMTRLILPTERKTTKV